jgi:hypothetical protein
MTPASILRRQIPSVGPGKDQGCGRSGPRTMSTVSLVVFALVMALAVPARADEHQAPISTVKGKSYRMASARMADSITRFADAADDQQRLDGTPEPEAPKWSDISAVYVAPTRMPAKLRTKMNRQHPPGTTGALYGDSAVPATRDRVVFVAVKMGNKLPARADGQQVEIGFSGDRATPVQAGTHLTTWAGTETFTLAGLFANGAYAAGATDVGGREPGLELDVDEYYDAESGALGFYQRGNATWYLVLPRAGDTEAITVSVRSTTGAGNVIDRLELPGGGYFIDLRDPGGGFKPKSGLPPLTCRSLETFSGESGLVEALAPVSNLVRYTAGVDPSVRPRDAAELLAPAVDSTGAVGVSLVPVGGEADPLTADGELAVAPTGNVISLTFEAPDGQWAFTLADELDPRTPAGEPIIDHRSLTGPAGLRVGPGLDGYVAGDPSCALEAAGEGSPGGEAAGDTDEGSTGEAAGE